jgi:hypothetical protein
MNSDQKRAVALALPGLREMKPDDYGPSPTGTWTEADWAVVRKANPTKQNKIDSLGASRAK